MRASRASTKARARCSAWSSLAASSKARSSLVPMYANGACERRDACVAAVEKCPKTVDNRSGRARIEPAGCGQRRRTRSGHRRAEDRKERLFGLRSLDVGLGRELLGVRFRVKPESIEHLHEP